MNKMFEINDVSQKCGDVVQHAEKFLPFAQQRMGFNEPVTINLLSDPENAKNPLGKTAYYDPNDMKIVIFVDKRHLKDIMRSMAHELVHHTQNCRGDLEGDNYTGPGYAQKDKHMRKMEGEAYLQGNLCFRDWEDSLKRENSEMNEAKLKNYILNLVKEVIDENNEVDEGRKKKKKAKKPDFPDVDGDGDRTEPISKAQADKKAKEGGKKRKKKKDLSKVPPQLRKTMKEEEELEEGGAAARTGNEDRDAGRGRMSADRVHEDSSQKIEEKSESGEKKYKFKHSTAKLSDGSPVMLIAVMPAEDYKDLNKRRSHEREIEKRYDRRERKRKKDQESKTKTAPKKRKKRERVKLDENKNWYKGNKDQLLFERLTKKWTK